MFEEIPLPLGWPVYVTQREAERYAAWAGKAIPTEEQFHRAAYGGNGRLYPWGNTAPAGDVGNFDFRRWDPEPVSETPGGKSAFGVHQLVGNGWEWTTPCLLPSTVSGPRHPIPATRQTSLMASITSSKEGRRALPRACCGVRSAIGFAPNIHTSTERFGALKAK